MDAFTLETVLLFVEYLYTGSYTASTIDMKVADNSDAVGSKKNSLSKDVSENSGIYGSFRSYFAGLC